MNKLTAATVPLIAFAIAGAALFSSIALAQSPEPTLPVADPNEIIYVGEVPAPQGTEVWGMYLVEEIVSCGTTQADEDSLFILVVDAECAFSLGPVICWGERPDWTGPEEFCEGFLWNVIGAERAPMGGDTIDVGLLRPASERPPPEVPIAPPHGDGVFLDVALPDVGHGATRGPASSAGWLVLAAALAGLALTLTSISLLLRRN